jgi:hypothetical protein
MILRGFSIKNQGLKHNYGYKLEVFGAKEWALDCGYEFLKGHGLDYKNQGLNCKGFIWWKDRLVNSEKVGDSLANLPANPSLTGKALLTGATRTDLSRWLRSGGGDCLQAKGAAAAHYRRRRLAGGGQKGPPATKCEGKSYQN